MKLSKEETTNAQQRIELTFLQVQEARGVLLLFPDKLKKKKDDLFFPIIRSTSSVTRHHEKTEATEAYCLNMKPLTYHLVSWEKSQCSHICV
jgi:hypothetical protein